MVLNDFDVALARAVLPSSWVWLSFGFFLALACYALLAKARKQKKTACVCVCVCAYEADALFGFKLNSIAVGSLCLFPVCLGVHAREVYARILNLSIY